MIEIDKALVFGDVCRTVDRWRSAGAKVGGSMPFGDAAEQAIALVSGEQGPADGVEGRFSIVTKGVHLRGGLPLACAAARLLCFGVTVRGLHRLTDPPEVAAALYPRAFRHFEHGPVLPAQWQAIDNRFGTDEFATIFGRPYDRTMVVPAAVLMREEALTGGALARIWEGGRPPVARDTLADRYGIAAARFITEGKHEYGWFRGRLPIGISRLGPGLTAFAMRDERIRGGDPIIVINGHVPGLTALFGPDCWALDLSLPAGNPGINDVRRWVAGDDSRPRACRPGSLRHDAITGDLTLTSAEPVTSRANLVHCSDGMLAGLLEARRLLPELASGPDLLTGALLAAGLTRAELNALVLTDPVIHLGDTGRHLTDHTCGLDLDACSAAVTSLVPPVFGPANGHADGVGPEMLASALERAPEEGLTDLSAGHLLTAGVDAGVDDDREGRAALHRGEVGVLTPAGGTGGRFGGYHVKESDPARMKFLVPLFEKAGRHLSTLDVRVANVRYWDAGDPERVPVALMASPTSEAALRRWRDGLGDAYRKTVRIFAQHGVYRLDTDRLGHGPADRWIDAILRDAGGFPSLKPAGTLGLVTAFVLSGLLELWEQRGVLYAAMANGDDAGFRLDPAVVGHLARHPEVDAVIVTVPWAFSATVRHGGRIVPVRGDDSGWLVDERGAQPTGDGPLVDLTWDAGGAVSVVPGPDGPALRVAESGRKPGSRHNTNQLYIRIAAIRRILGGADAPDLLLAIRRLWEGMPLRTETKSVLLDGVTRQARQVAQPLHGLLLRLSRCDVLAGTRRLGPDVRSTYAPLKRPADVAFARQAVDRLADELMIPAAW